MVTLSDYFSKLRYKPKFFIGDRVEGKFNGIPFVGTVYNDSKISEGTEPKVTIQLDLPICYKDTVYDIIFMKPNTLKARK